MSFEVMSRKCDQCLLSPERIVSASRMRQIVAKCRREDSSFECHKGMMAGRKIACRGHWETGVGQMSRIAQRLRMVVFIDPETLAPASGIEARSGETAKQGSTEGESPAPAGGDAHEQS
jgi:hypothetical protein